MEATDTRPLWIRLLAPTRGKVIFGIVCAIVGYGAYWWIDGGRHYFTPRNWGVVEEGLIYRCGQMRERVIEPYLTDYDIELIIDLDIDDADDENEQAEIAIAKRLGVRKVTLEGVDGSGVGDLEVYVRALTEMVEAKRKKTRTILHCVGGSARTGAATAWYRLLVQGWTPSRAFEEMWDYRRRDDGGRLQRFMNENMAQLAKRLVETGALESVPDPLPVFGP